ncbi:hypothetical protein [Streptomyces sp. NPDC047108]|uniref:hypothetical protein n=1 Tax=Streptomyces sp. NPDC047108 TaxID=3155025 RepID=UPI003405AA60
MGIMLMPDDDDINSPDVSWAYTEFADFRRLIASEEGIPLDRMQGFGGSGSWGEVRSPLLPFLDHPDNEGEIAYRECRAMLPRLRDIVAHWEGLGASAVSPGCVDKARSLVSVLEVCVREKASLLFA